MRRRLLRAFLTGSLSLVPLLVLDVSAALAQATERPALGTYYYHPAPAASSAPVPSTSGYYYHPAPANTSPPAGYYYYYAAAPGSNPPAGFYYTSAYGSAVNGNSAPAARPAVEPAPRPAPIRFLRGDRRSPAPSPVVIDEYAYKS